MTNSMRQYTISYPAVLIPYISKAKLIQLNFQECGWSHMPVCKATKDSKLQVTLSSYTLDEILESIPLTEVESRTISEIVMRVPEVLYESGKVMNSWWYLWKYIEAITDRPERFRSRGLHPLSIAGAFAWKLNNYYARN